MLDHWKRCEHCTYVLRFLMPWLCWFEVGVFDLVVFISQNFQSLTELVGWLTRLLPAERISSRLSKVRTVKGERKYYRTGDLGLPKPVRNPRRISELPVRNARLSRIRTEALALIHFPTHCADTLEWRRQAARGSFPGHRFSAAAALVDARGGDLLIYGGCDEELAPTSGFFVLLTGERACTIASEQGICGLVFRFLLFFLFIESVFMHRSGWKTM